MCAVALNVSKSPIIFLLLILNSMYEIVMDTAGVSATGSVQLFPVTVGHVSCSLKASLNNVESRVLPEEEHKAWN